MQTVTALGYIRLGAPDPSAWREFAIDVLGLQLGDAAAGLVRDGSLYLKQDERSYRIAIDQSDKKSLTFGWEVQNPEALDCVAGRLDAMGIDVTAATAEEAQRRLVTGLLRCTDPAGNYCEIFYGAKNDNSEFVSPTGARFVTGEMGLGHAFVVVPDRKAYEAFYIDALGFRVSDYIQGAHGEATFLHCNPRHHTLAYVEVAGMSALHHFMVEVDDVDPVGRGYDRCSKGSGSLRTTIGRHTNDEMLSFYCASPTGTTVEYGTGGLQVDDATWTVQRFDAASRWGHADIAPG